MALSTTSARNNKLPQAAARLRFSANNPGQAVDNPTWIQTSRSNESNRWTFVSHGNDPLQYFNPEGSGTYSLETLDATEGFAQFDRDIAVFETDAAGIGEQFARHDQQAKMIGLEILANHRSVLVSP